MPLKKFYVIGHGIVFVPYIQKVFGKRATQLSSQFDSVILILVKTRSLFLFPSFITKPRFWQNYFGPESC